MLCKTDGQKEEREPNGDVGIDGNSGSDGKGEWTGMVQVLYVLRRDNGHVLRKALEFEVKGKKKQG